MSFSFPWPSRVRLHHTYIGGGESPPQETLEPQSNEEINVARAEPRVCFLGGLRVAGGDAGRDTGAPSIMVSSFLFDVNQVFQVGASNISGDSEG